MQNSSPKIPCIIADLCLPGVSLTIQVQRSYLIQNCINVLLQSVFFLRLTLYQILKLMLDANVHLTIFPENLPIVIFIPPPTTFLYVFLVLLFFCLDCSRVCCDSRSELRTSHTQGHCHQRLCIITWYLSSLGEKYHTSTCLQPSPTLKCLSNHIGSQKVWFAFRCGLPSDNNKSPEGLCEYAAFLNKK